MKPFIPQKLPLQEIYWEPLVPLISRANRALAHYDGVLYGVPNPSVLLSPLTTQEAVLSSKIEGTQATLGDVLKFEGGEEPIEKDRKLDIQEILNYRKALLVAEDELQNKAFHLNLLFKLHAILLESVRGQGKSPGKLRMVQNWIGAGDDPIEKAKFIPPEPALLMEYMNNWENYYHMDDLDPLVQLAVIHAQFEIIHPFMDGNGRMGRILIPLFLYEKKILSKPMFYLSAYLEEHRNTYIERLRALGQARDAWNQWILFFLKALEEQAGRNATTARAIMDLYEDLKQRVVQLTRSRFAIPLLDQLFSKPIFKSSQIVLGEHQPSRQVIQKLLQMLREVGILKVVAEATGRRAQTLALAELVNLCEGKEVF